MSQFTGTENYIEEVEYEVRSTYRVLDGVAGEHGVPASHEYHTKNDTRDVLDPEKPFYDYLVDTTVREVILNVYELPHHKEWNKWLEQYGFGYYHTSIEIVALTAPNHVGNSWSQTILPTSDSPSLGYIFKYSKKGGYQKLAHYDTSDPLKEKISLGRHEGNYSHIICHIREVANDGGFEAENYDDVNKNSNHFCDAVSRRLLGKGIPAWINRSTTMGAVDLTLPPPPAYLDFLRDISKDGIMPLIESVQVSSLATKSMELFSKNDLDIRTDLEVENEQFNNLPVLRHGAIITDLKEYQSVQMSDKEKDDALGTPFAVNLVNAGAALTGIPSLIKIGSSLFQAAPEKPIVKEEDGEDSHNPWKLHYKPGDSIHPDTIEKIQNDLKEEIKSN